MANRNRDPFDDPFFHHPGMRDVMPSKREGASFLGCGCLTLIGNLILLAIVVVIIVFVAKAVWG